MTADGKLYYVTDDGRLSNGDDNPSPDDKRKMIVAFLEDALKAGRLHEVRADDDEDFDKAVKEWIDRYEKRAKETS